MQQQVFISHTGKDEDAKTFAASILKPALEAAGLKVFIDFRDLELGDPWPERLIEAACRSAVMVVVLSRSYTDRFWCMLELDLAMHGSSQYPRVKPPLIIPVFYDDPDSIVRVEAIKHKWVGLMPADTTLPQQQQQQQQQQQEEEEHQPQQQQQQQQPQQQEQRKLLAPDQVPFVNPECWARNIYDMKERLQNARRSGVAAADAKDRGWQLAMRVVVRAVPAVFVKAWVEDGVVGYEEQLAGLLAAVLPCKVKPDLRPKAEYEGAWIHGLGGSGKTVMARLLFNRLGFGFSYRALIELNPEDGKEQTRQHLVDALKALGAKEFDRDLPPAQLLSVLQEYVQDKAVLITIDNVWTPWQLDDLLPPRLGAGSRVIITSRYETLHESRRFTALCNSHKLYHHELELLDRTAAQDLLRLRAGLGLKDPLPDGLAALETEVIKACGGLPLVLEVLGAQLATRKTDPRAWKAVFSMIVEAKPVPNANISRELHAILVTSFNCLTEAPQNMFLDVASVLHGQDSRTALRIWDAWWKHADNDLAELKRLALVKVDEEDHTLRVHDVIRSFARGIILGKVKVEPAAGRGSFVGSRVWFEEGDNLVVAHEAPASRLVALSTVGHPHLTWDVVARCKPEHLHIFIAHEIVGPNSLDGFISLAAPLQWLDLSYCFELSSLPRSMTQLTGLQVLDLRACKKLSSLPEAVGQLTALIRLDLSGCCELSHLPESVGRLTALEQLDLSECRQLRTLPESVSKLTALQQFYLSGCGEQRRVPESVWRLTALQELDLSNCKQLSSLPESVGQLTALQVLALSGCSQLSSLSESVGQLTALQELHLGLCEQLSSLPQSVGQLTALQGLNISNCEQLGSLPESVGQLTALQGLDLRGCKQLSSLPKSIGQLTALQGLDLFDCSQLSSLPESVGQLTALQKLRLSGCKQLSSLPESVGQLTALQELHLGGCEQLSSLPESVAQLAALQELHLGGCEQLSSLPEWVGQLTALLFLDLRGCKQLSSLPESVGQLHALQWLFLTGCRRLGSLPGSVGQLTALQELPLGGCEQLSRVPDSVGQLTALQRLDISGCKQLSSLPESVWQLPSLQRIDFSDFEQRHKLTGS